MRPRSFDCSIARHKARFGRAHSLGALALMLAACGEDPLLTGTTPDSTEDASLGLDSGLRDAGGGVVEGRVRVDAGGGSVTLPERPCTGLQCQQTACAGGGITTTISGTVYDPAGKNPLYNVAVYVPNTKVEPLESGASCNTCEALYTGKPIASTLTDAKGQFKLENAPVGKDIPLVVQVGKWRRQLTVPTVTGCQDNPQVDKSLRLPKNRQEGDIPLIAVSTGGADTLECLLRRVGVDASEFVPGGTDPGRIHIFAGSPSGNNQPPNTATPGPLSSAALWNDRTSLQKYDIVLLSCEGAETRDMNQQALHDYASTGGRVFASHFHYSWFNSGPYASENLGTWQTGSRDIGDINADIVTMLSDGKPFVKGQALYDWLGNTSALQNNKLRIAAARNNVTVTAANTPSQQWIVADNQSSAAGAAQYISFNTPTVEEITDTPIGTCGRVVFSDLHVGAASADDAKKPVPTGCSDKDLSPQEKALEFMLFDLSSCIVPDTAPPEPPVVVAI